MTFDELYEYVRVYSGNFIIPEEAMEVGLNQFHLLLKNSIGWYQRYTPLVFTFNINTHGSVNYTFVGYEYPRAGDWQVPLIPKKLSDVFPVYATFYNPFTYLAVASGNATLTSLSSAPKAPFIWRYDADKGQLHLDRGGELEIKATYYHPIIERTEEITTETGEVITRHIVDLPSINPTDIDFLDMITARYLLVLGRARSLFQYSDSTVTFDAQGLISEGSNMLQAAQQSIIDNAKFYLAW